MRNTIKDPFDNIYFWIKVIKVFLVVFIPYWLFGFEAGILVGIVVISLFLSKISLTVLEIYEQLHDKPDEKKSTKKASSKFPHKPDAEGKIIGIRSVGVSVRGK
jgi:hypothetical protein